MTVAPDLVEPFRAWRVWRVRDGRLRSAFSPYAEWEPGRPLRAVCNPAQAGLDDEHTAPDECCSCGVWGLKRRDPHRGVALYEFGLNPNLLVIGRHIVGRVALWGNVVEYEHGWRAEYAYPLALPDAQLAILYRCDLLLG